MAELDGLRGIAILLVVGVHTYAPVVPGGNAGVDLFFVLSGFLITTLLYERHRSRGRIDLRGFWVRRAQRLLPALAVLLAALLVFSATTLRDVGSLVRREVLFAGLFAGNLYPLFHGFDPRPVLGQTWSLGIEEQFYLVWPLVLVGVGSAFRRPGRFAAGVAAFALASAIVGRVLVAGILDYPHWKSIPLFNLDGIALGCALAAALQSGWALPFDRARRQVLVWVLVALAALDVLFADHWDSAFHDAREVAARLLFVGILAVVVVDRPPLLSRVLRWRVLTFLGSISYALYLWHTPLREILSPERIDTVPRWALSAASLGGAVAIATLSLHLVERPVLAWRRRPERSGRPLADAVPAMRQVLPASATAGERGMIGVGGGDEH